MPTLYAFSVLRTGDAVNPVTGTVANYNSTYMNDGQLNVTTGIYTVPVAGLYRFDFSGIKHNNNTATEVRFYLNGSATSSRCYANSTNSTEYVPVAMMLQAQFNAGDQVKVVVTAGGVHGNESCYFSGYRMR